MGPANHLLIVLEKTKVILISRMISIILNILLNLFLIPLFGLTGAAVATAFSLIFYQAVVLIISKRHLRLRLFNINQFKAVVASLPIILTAAFFYKNNLSVHNLGYIILIMLGLIITYIIILIPLKIITKEEKQMAMVLFNNIKERFTH